jgi:uncharacterized protein (UPF0212 family)
MVRPKYVQVDINHPGCPKCGSQKREKYHNTRELLNVTIRGVNYARLVIRRTRCKECGQCRDERTLYQEKSAERGGEVDRMAD